MAIRVRHVIVWICLPLVNFMFWLSVGIFFGPSSNCSSEHDRSISSLVSQLLPRGHPVTDPTSVHVSLLSTKDLMKYREDRLVHLNFQFESLSVGRQSDPLSCSRYAQMMESHAKIDCAAVVFQSTLRSSHNLLRFTSNVSLPTPQVLVGSGLFGRTGNAKGRKRFIEKFNPLLQQLDAVSEDIQLLLDNNNVARGGDVTVIVVNDGQMDLFMNYACSCNFHNISLSNTLVFATSKDILPLIASTGAIPIYHVSFAAASKESSKIYLDGVFVDMMWYKAFSLWLTLRMGYSVLFQDADIVWFRDPFEYFHNDMNACLKRGDKVPHGYFSDDGQRGSPRYAPFFANSGFFYLRQSDAMVNMAYNIMLGFDTMQSTGSHQNVFTVRLIEAMDMIGLWPRLLILHEFSNGAMYHHDKAFMKAIAKKEKLPYIFHMCWTAHKSQKLEYFKKEHMWYLQETCSLESIIAPGAIAEYANSLVSSKSKGEVTPAMFEKCCYRHEKAP